MFSNMLAVENRVLLSILQWQDFIVTKKKDGVNTVMAWLWKTDWGGRIN